MTDTNKTHITIVLDRSGSMDTIKTQTIKGFNKFVQQQRAQPGDATLTLLQFNTELSLTTRNQPINQVSDLNTHTFFPNGGTALLDAIGVAITELGQELHKLPEEARPGKVVMVIITDGEENASRIYKDNYEAVRKMVEHQSSVYNWQFVFLAANQSAEVVAKRLGITVSATFAGEKSEELFTATSESISSLRRGLTKGINYSASQIKSFA